MQHLIILPIHSCKCFFKYFRDRIGYDGTIHTPSFQLLKPTACSIGHRVPIRMQTTYSPKTTRRDHLSKDTQERGSHNVSQNIPRFDNSQGMGAHIATKVFACHDSPATAALDPFGRLNRSNHSESDDEDMDQTSSSLLADFDLDVDVSTPEIKYYSPTERDASQPTQKFTALPPSPLQRCSSWSPGANTLRQSDAYSKGGRDSDEISADRRRSFNVDPVASQLLRACSVHDDEEEEMQQQDSDPVSKSCNARIPAAKWSNNKAASMPDLLNPVPPVRGRSKTAPTIAEETPINCPLSPAPLFRDVSDSLLDVKTEEDIKSLPRPVPRKITGSSHNRRSSLPFSFSTSLP